ncbi:N-acyl amino acid synthase FeeM domain-containing protein [Noviherbaspirillum sedimenti]|uniref:Long-chain N-acyl amino acid synthase n=1 Tax=Noviherbaspirillum sedimenti TaxID=2320865 RepID=A0A3A3G8I9_9BURK|nr:hypothetical protein [Noviherbaspirillum sedimenti]RJG03069.1 hypothetical protein D3878_17030 [Noviherbaspirillum sedimenti]
MDTQLDTPLLSPHHLEYRPLQPQQPRPAATAEERLPFTVRLVHNQQDLSKALQIRYAAYARHVPSFAESLKLAEPTDSNDGVAILLAESKFDGSPLGTMRIQTNGFNPLSLEQSVELPDWLQDKSLAEATRLGVTEQKVGRIVKTVLFKAYYLYCVQNGIDWMVIAGRSPIDRQYDRLLFSDVYPGMGYIPLRHANNMPHRVLAFEVGTAEERWNLAKHPLTNFIFHTSHPDINIGSRNPAQLQ